MVCCRLAYADADRSHDPDAAHSFHSEPSGHSRHYADRQHHGARHLSPVLTGRRASGNGAVAPHVLHLAGWNSAELLPTHAARQNNLHPAFRTMVVKRGLSGTRLWKIEALPIS